MDKDKQIEIEDGYLDPTNNYSIQNIDSNNPQNIIFDNKLNDKVEYDRYDEDGKLLEFHSLENGSYTCIIWGYKKQFPAAIIKNARYSEVESFVPNIQSYSNQNIYSISNVNLLVSELDNLRNSLPNAMVNTYIYQGRRLLMATNERGENVTYEYNDYNELETIKDNEGNIIEKYEYNFKTLSNFTLNYVLSDINWLNPVNFIQVGYTINCDITPIGGSGDYTYNWTLKKNGNILLSGNEQISSIHLANQNFTGNLVLEYEVVDNYTGISLSKTKNFYVYLGYNGANTLFFSNISEGSLATNALYSHATVTSAQADTLRFWVFNLSTGGTVQVDIKGTTYTIGNYQTLTIEVPVIAGETVDCYINGSGNFNYTLLEILPPVNGTANVVSPKTLNLNNN